jgi:lactosylceramide 4-alpha-galactosyltransferase
MLYLNVTAGNKEVHLRSAIFFLETSGRPFYTPRDLCALESAARHHPNKTIVMGTSSQYLLNTAIQLAVTSRHKNIQFVRFNFTALALRTPLEDWLVDRPDHPLKLGSTGVEHSSDILRCVVLYIFGGTYMDTDVIVLKPLDQLRNAVALAYHVAGSELTNTAFLAMDRGHAFLEQFLDETRWK